MKNIFYILLLLPTIIFAQYPSNSGHKITLGEQTTADGLIYRGVLGDTFLITPSSDTSAYIILDTVNHRFYNYNRATNVWSVTTIGSISSGLTGVLPVANGGTNTSTLTANKVLVGNGTSAVLTPTNLHWDNSNNRLGINATSPTVNLHITGNQRIFYTEFPALELYRNLNVGEVGPAGQGFFLGALDNNIPINAGGVFANLGNPSTTGNLVFFTRTDNNLTEKMRIVSNGNVGIGTATPAEKLSVNGAIISTGGITGHGANRTTISQEGANGAYWQSYGANTSTIGRFTLRQASSDFSLTREPLVIESTGVATFSSSVIGTSFEVGNGQYYRARRTSSNLLIDLLGIESGTDNTRLLITGDYNIKNGSLTTLFNMTTTGAATFSSSVSATSLTTTNGNIRIESAGISGSPLLTFYSKDGAAGVTMESGRIMNIAETINGWGLSFLTKTQGGSLSEKMRITNGGNVGIGTTSPRGKAEFVTGLPTSIPIFSNTTNGIVVSDGGAIYGRMGVSNFSAAGAGYPTYIQAGDFDGAIYYNLLFNPLGGNVGIGTTTPQSGYRLHVVDSVYVGGNVSASAYTTRSDYNLKDDIFDIKYGLNDVLQLQPVEYTYKSNGSKQLGFIAQDIGTILPEVVSFEESMSVNYQAIIPILTKAIQEQNLLIKALEQRIINLENK